MKKIIIAALASVVILATSIPQAQANSDTENALIIGGAVLGGMILGHAITPRAHAYPVYPAQGYPVERYPHYNEYEDEVLYREVCRVTKRTYINSYGEAVTKRKRKCEWIRVY